MRRFYVVSVVVLGACTVAPDLPNVGQAQQAVTAQVENYKITILADQIAAGPGAMAQWGFSAWLELTSGGVTKKVLFDTGRAPTVVLTNAQSLGIDICQAESMILSHHHNDHVGGVMVLRSHCVSRGILTGLSKIYVGGPEILCPRITPAGAQTNPFVSLAAQYQATGGTLITVDQPGEMPGIPGLVFSGKIPRVHQEMTWLPTVPGQTMNCPGAAPVPDEVVEEQAVWILAPDKTVVITGCAHAGAVNTVLKVHEVSGPQSNILLMGGLHWMNMPLGDNKTVGTVVWEGRQLEDLNVKAMVGGHCTGYERVVYLRTALGLDPVDAPLAGVGNTVTPAGWGFGWTLNVTKPLLDDHGDGALMCYQGFHGNGHDQ